MLNKKYAHEPKSMVPTNLSKTKNIYTFAPLLFIRGDFNVPPVVQLSFFYKQVSLQTINFSSLQLPGFISGFYGGRGCWNINGVSNLA